MFASTFVPLVFGLGVVGAEGNYHYGHHHHDPNLPNLNNIRRPNEHHNKHIEHGWDNESYAPTQQHQYDYRQYEYYRPQQQYGSRSSRMPMELNGYWPKAYYTAQANAQVINISDAPVVANSPQYKSVLQALHNMFYDDNVMKLALIEKDFVMAVYVLRKIVHDQEDLKKLLQFKIDEFAKSLLHKWRDAFQQVTSLAKVKELPNKQLSALREAAVLFGQNKHRDALYALINAGLLVATQYGVDMPNVYQYIKSLQGLQKYEGTTLRGNLKFSSYNDGNYYQFKPAAAEEFL